MRKNKFAKPIVVIKVGVLARYHGRVLLIRERHNPSHPYRWNIIKGTFEPAIDPDITHAAIREAREEARARVQLKRLLGVYYLRDDRKSLIMFTFIADLLSLPQKARKRRRKLLQKNNEDIIETRLFTRKELARLTLKDFVGRRGYLAIQDYLRGKRFSLKLMITLPPKKVRRRMP